MTPEEFAPFIRPKIVNGVETVPVAHNARTLESVIDGTDDTGEHGSMWHMDDSYPQLEMALFNLEHIMGRIGWRIDRPAEEWCESDSAPDIYVADFTRKPTPVAVMDGDHRRG